MKIIGFLGCVKSKRDTKNIAKEMYTSPLFRKARKYIESNYDEWYILSAKYHLLGPEDEIEPYNETLNDKNARERIEWSKIVSNQIIEEIPDSKNCKLYFHAGKKYREYLLPLLRDAEYSLEVPLANLGIGQQLAWYDKQGDRKFKKNMNELIEEEAIFMQMTFG